MVDRNLAPQETLPRRTIQRILGSVAMVLTASAVLVLSAVPFGWLSRQHLLPDAIATLFLVLLAPIIIVWNHVKFYFLLIVTGCELALAFLQPGVRKARVEALAAVGICAAAYLFLYLSGRYNFH